MCFFAHERFREKNLKALIHRKQVCIMYYVFIIYSNVLPVRSMFYFPYLSLRLRIYHMSVSTQWAYAASGHQQYTPDLNNLQKRVLHEHDLLGNVELNRQPMELVVVM